MERDDRNRRGKGESKHGYSATEQKRIDEIKLKKAVAREVTLQNQHNKQKEETEPAQDDKLFGQKFSRKLKAGAAANTKFNFHSFCCEVGKSKPRSNKQRKTIGRGSGP